MENQWKCETEGQDERKHIEADLSENYFVR